MILFLGILTPMWLQGQQLLHSPDEDIDESSRLVQVIGQVGDLTACFMERYDGNAIIWYDSLMRKVGESKLNFLERGAEMFRFYGTDDAVFAFYQKRKRKNLELWAVDIPPIHKDTIIPQRIDSMVLDGNWDKSRFALYDQSAPNRFVYSFISSSKKADRSTVKLKVLNYQFGVVLEHEEEFTEVDNLGIIDIRIGAYDKVYTLMANGQRTDNFYGEIWMGVLNRGGQKIILKQLKKLDDYMLASPRIQMVSGSQQFIIGGMLYKKFSNTFDGLGAFPFSTSSLSWESPSITKLSNVTFEASNLDLNDLRLRQFLIQKDGGYTYVLEKSFMKIFNRNRSMGIMPPNIGLGSSSYTVYHDDELYAISTNHLGKISWNKTILKSQETSDANVRFQSFGMLSSNLGNVFLFRDKLNGDERFITAFLSNRGDLTLRQFDPSNYRNIASDGLILKASKQVAVNQLVFPIISRGTLSFAKIVF